MQKLCKNNACLIDHLIAKGDYPTKGILIILTILLELSSSLIKSVPEEELSPTAKYFSHLEAVLKGL